MCATPSADQASPCFVTVCGGSAGARGLRVMGCESGKNGAHRSEQAARCGGWIHSFMVRSVESAPAATSRRHVAVVVRWEQGRLHCAPTHASANPPIKGRGGDVARRLFALDSTARYRLFAPARTPARAANRKRRQPEILFDECRTTICRRSPTARLPEVRHLDRMPSPHTCFRPRRPCDPATSRRDSARRSRSSPGDRGRPAPSR